VPAPSDPETDAFLQLVDLLDAEANAVTHAVIRAQATLRSIVDEARTLLEGPEPDGRAWAEVGVRLMQHRAVLVDALAIVCRTAGEDPALRQPPVTVTATPISCPSPSVPPLPPPPSPFAVPLAPAAVAGAPVLAPPAPLPTTPSFVAPAPAPPRRAAVVLPAPPLLRHRSAPARPA
jgi:hypothetical protein